MTISHTLNTYKDALVKRTLGIIALIISLALFVISCSDERVLYVYNWSYYTPEEVIDAFEEEYDCKVVMDYFASNEEMFAKLMISKDKSGYDIVIPSADYVSIMMKLGMVEPIDKSKIPNLKYLTDFAKEKASHDPEQNWSVPYYIGALGIAVNKERVEPGYPHDYTIFNDQRYKGKMCMMDDLREVLGAALLELGYSCNTYDEKELEEATEYIIDNWKPNLAKFDAEGFAKSFATGDCWIVQGYAESFYEELPESRWDEMDFFIPEETTLYIDSMVIPKGSKHIDLAHEFINFMLEPSNYAKFLDRFGFPPALHKTAGEYMIVEPHYTSESLYDGENKDDLGEYLDMYNKAWERIRYIN